MGEDPPPANLVYWCREPCMWCIWAAVMNRSWTVVCDAR